MAKAIAFLRRDFAIATSYRLQFVFQLLSGLFAVTTYYFIAKVVGDRASEALRTYDTDYFSFVLIGVAATGFLLSGLQLFTERLRIGMVEGSLEMMFVTPTRPSTILIMPCLWSFVFEASRGIIVVLFGVVVLGADLTRANLPAALLVVLLSVTTYTVFGLLSAAMVIVLKRGDPIGWALANATALLGGAYFPVELMPTWLKTASQWLPMTYSFEALRLTLLAGRGFADVQSQIAILACFSAIGLPIAAFVTERAVSRAKRHGTLGSF